MSITFYQIIKRKIILHLIPIKDVSGALLIRMKNKKSKFHNSCADIHKDQVEYSLPSRIQINKIKRIDIVSRGVKDL